jgi:hypothetical protein
VIEDGRRAGRRKINKMGEGRMGRTGTGRQKPIAD